MFRRVLEFMISHHISYYYLCLTDESETKKDLDLKLFFRILPTSQHLKLKCLISYIGDLFVKLFDGIWIRR